MEQEGRGARVYDSNNWSPALQLRRPRGHLSPVARVASSFSWHALMRAAVLARVQL